MLKLDPTLPPAPVQCSCSTQPPYSLVTRLWPAALPAGLVTSQSPSQKSNWRYSGAVQGVAGGGAAWAAAAERIISRQVKKRRMATPQPFEYTTSKITCQDFPPSLDTSQS